MTKKLKLKDPKADAHPALSYGGSQLAVGIEVDEKDRPQRLTVTVDIELPVDKRLTVTVDIELPVDTKLTKLDQDLLAACRTVGEASKYLKDREDFFKEQIRLRLQTKGCKQQAGFLSGHLTAQNSKDFSWKDFAIEQLTKLIQLKEGCSKKRAEVLAKDRAKKAQDKAPVKKKDSKGNKIQPKVSVKGVILEA
jgi:hypothetical protein